MKKALSIIGICLTIWSCKTPPITVLRDRPPTKGMVPVQLDETYELFVRSVCKDSITKAPIDCIQGSKELVEVQYMFLSRKKGVALVINNVPNRNQRFYDGTSVNKVFNETAEINSLYFKQFRFGTIEPAEGGVLLHFVTTDKKPRKYVWTCREIDTTKNPTSEPGYLVESVQIGLVDGYDLRRSEDALYLVPKFVKKTNFKIIYEVTSGAKKGVPNPKPELPNNTFWICKTSRRYISTFLIFDDYIDNAKNTTVKFPPKRMYAY